MLTRQTIGYSAQEKNCVGTWGDNNSDFPWQYKGSVDETGRTFTLEANGPSMSDPDKTALFRDMYEFVSVDEIKLTSSVQGPDGKWIDFVTGTAKRDKQLGPKAA